MAELEATGALKFEDRGEEIVLTKEDLLIDSAKMPGYESVADYGITVVIDTNLTEELIEEGFVREIVSKIQTMRKDSGFEVMDNINIYVSGDAKVVAIAEKNAEFIMGETLGKSLVNAENENAKEWDINGKKVKIAVEKL
jgi:isoleucyl-tRNA synthetase